MPNPSPEAQTNEYLNKHQLFGPFIVAPPHADLRLCVVIPVHDEPDLSRCVVSLSECAAPNCAVEVLLVINDCTDDSPAVAKRNAKTLSELQAIVQQYSRDRFTIHPIDARAMPNKHAGVGLARKVGMDEAVRRFARVQAVDGLIVSLDADCYCAHNYLLAIEQHFDRHTRTSGCSIYFEHPLPGDANCQLRAGIVRYELGLRYYKNALMKAGFPFSCYTVGSAMVVRDRHYQAQGGMNRRQAGEDFYFLQKFVRLGGFTELNLTTVYPSPRVSTRVPFGTGRAQQRWLTGDTSVGLNFSIEGFKSLACLSAQIPGWYNTQSPDFGGLPSPIREFLANQKADSVILDIRQQVASRSAFVKRVYRWFDAFTVYKYLKWSAERAYPMVLVEEAVLALIEWISPTSDITDTDPDTLLMLLRQSDRGGVTTGVDLRRSSYN